MRPSFLEASGVLSKELFLQQCDAKKVDDLMMAMTTFPSAKKWQEFSTVDIMKRLSYDMPKKLVGSQASLPSSQKNAAALPSRTSIAMRESWPQWPQCYPIPPNHPTKDIGCVYYPPTDHGKCELEKLFLDGHSTSWLVFGFFWAISFDILWNQCTGEDDWRTAASIQLFTLRKVGS